MSQECPFGNSGAEHRSEPNHSQSTEEVTIAAPAPNRFWRMMTDPGFLSLASNPAPFVVTIEVFLGLTNQVQALAGMVQTIDLYSHLKSASISSFDLLAKEFELDFLASARPKPTTTSLLGLVQGSDEPLSQFVGQFTSQVQGILDLHPSVVIQALLIGLRPSRFF
ncbi:hypothetical protein B296_00024710 [Ensete ventricosum]|uniref:Retrotransposon gag domain-containing protein n=1 Tax=Ensete ventricosum TaxID=4639 RepID=A0A426XRB3_ENSVE|nr:hypothetical protein B296_00024710 [Ensete ventricosum]